VKEKKDNISDRDAEEGLRKNDSREISIPLMSSLNVIP